MPAQVPKKRIVQIKNVRPRGLTLGRRRGVQGIRSNVDDLLFHGHRFRSKVSDAILEANLRRTIEGASTIELTLADDKRELLTRPIFQTQFDLEIDNLWFRLQAINDGGDDLGLTFEARDVNRLRRKTGHLKALRKDMTRAEFILLMVRELKHPAVPFFSPQLHVVQPIRSRREHRKTRKDRDERREPGLGPGSNITVKGVRANSDQIRIAETILDVGMSLNANKRVLIMAIACATQESNMVDLETGDYAAPNSKGPFGMNLLYYPNAGDLVAACRYMYLGIPDHAGLIETERANPGMSFTETIATVQRPREDLRGLYQQWREEATRTVEEYLGGSSTGTTTYEVEKKIPYAYERKEDENSWAAMTRLASEVRWRVFETNGLVYYVSDDYLLRSRVRALITPDTPGIDTIRATYHGNKKVEEATITGRAREWAAPPGTVVRIAGRGKANGRWLVHDVSSSLFSEDFEASLRRPVEPLPEPPPEVKTITRTVSGDSPGGSSGGPTDDLSQVKIQPNTGSGSPYWGGTWPVFKQFIIPFMKEQGLTEWTGKRDYNTGSGISDHYTGSTEAFAADFPTNSGESIARALAQAMNAPYSPGSWNHGTITVDGLTFAVQILWAAPDGTHYDHIHVGLHRA